MAAGSVIAVRLRARAELLPGANIQSPRIAKATATAPMIRAVRTMSFSADDHVANFHRWRGNGANKFHVIADHFDVPQHLAQIARNGDFVHRISELAVFDPHSDGAPGIIAGHYIHTEADQLHHVES